MSRVIYIFFNVDIFDVKTMIYTYIKISGYLCTI